MRLRTFHDPVRRPAAAGTFYPAAPGALRDLVDRLLADAPRRPAIHPVALVVPHAGYVYSGSTAAEAYVLLAGGDWDRVVVAGPAHYAGPRGVAVPSQRAFDTPLGPVPVDGTAVAALQAEGLAVTDDDAHVREHSLEVQLPFLQRTVGDVPVVPLAVGPIRPEQMAAVLDAVWTPRTLVVVSTDLSHYQPHDVACRQDRRTADAIVAADPDGIGPDDACGRHALRGFLVAARSRGLAITELALRTSGDTAGERSSVVGYGAFAASLPPVHEHDHTATGGTR